MLENLFGKDNDMLIWIFLLLMLSGNCGDFDDEFIWIILLFMLCNNDCGCKR